MHARLNRAEIGRTAPDISAKSSSIDEEFVTAAAVGRHSLSEGTGAERVAASGDVVQRVVVQSNWLRMLQPAPVDAESGGAARSKREEFGEPEIETAERVSGPFAPVNDKSNSQYRDAAEEMLGRLAPLEVLAKWNVIPNGPTPFARSHLIAAEFGGQRQYPAAENIRFHPRAVEYGTWQHDETRVKRGGQLGYLTVRSTESGDAIKLADAILAKLRGTLLDEYLLTLAAPLAHLLRAANFVPFDVSFDYSEVGSGTAVSDRWSGLDASLSPAAASPGDIIGALLELKIIVPEELPPHIAQASGTPTRTLASRADLVSLLGDFCGGAGSARKTTIAKKLNSLAVNPHLSDESFAKQIKGLPELAKANITVVVNGGYRTWIGAALGEDLR